MLKVKTTSIARTRHERDYEYDIIGNQHLSDFLPEGIEGSGILADFKVTIEVSIHASDLDQAIAKEQEKIEALHTELAGCTDARAALPKPSEIFRGHLNHLCRALDRQIKKCEARIGNVNAKLERLYKLRGTGIYDGQKEG